MPKLIDLTGQQFGRWYVLGRSSITKNKAVYWTCQCECGTIKDVKGSSLRENKSKSCGCLHKELSQTICQKIGQNNFNNLKGQKIGEFTILYDTGKRGPNGCIIWHCICSCGTEKDIPSKELLRNPLIHCGCKKILSKGEEKIANILQENNILFEEQKSFEDCRFLDTNYLAKFDFYVNNTYLIEYDGIQHFTSSGTWITEEILEKIKQRDAYKNQYCKEHNIPLIRIPYTHYDNLCLEDLMLETSTFINH